MRYKILVLIAATACTPPTETSSVTTVEIVPAVVNLPSLGSVQLSTRTFTRAGKEVSALGVAWFSSNNTLATVSSSGLLRSGRNLGGAVDSVTIQARLGDVSGTRIVEIRPIPISSIAISPVPIALRPGQTLQLAAFPTDDAGNPLLGRSFSWTVSDTSVLSVSATGLLRASPYGGTSTRLATVAATAESRTSLSTATISPAIGASVAFPDSVTIRLPNQVFSVVPVVRDSLGNILQDRAVTFASSDPQVGTVTSTGVVTTLPYTGGQTRRTTVTAFLGGIQGSTVVIVQPTPVSRVVVSPDSATLSQLRDIQLNFAAFDSVGGPLTGRSALWRSNDSTIATVTPSGFVSTRLVGSRSLASTFITATVDRAIGAFRLIVSPFLTDPAEIEVRLTDATRSWVNTYMGMSGNAPMLTAAQTYTASWNNYEMNYYSSLDADGTRLSRPWNSESASVRGLWDGYYAALFQASDVLDAIQLGNSKLETDDATQAARALALLIRGASLGGLALNYDRAVLTPSMVGSLVNRRIVLNAAISALDSAAAFSASKSFVTRAGWLGNRSMSAVEIFRVANTLSAFLLANWPRTALENSLVNWSRVVEYASQGLSSSGNTDFQFVGDGCSRWCPEILTWFNSLDTGRLHTRIASMLDGSQRDPWPVGGNPQPNSLDRRLGDGSFGNASMIAAFGNIPRTGNAGSDFAWSSQAPFNMARGSYHQSNIGHVRYDESGVQSPMGIYAGFGTVTLLSATQNDLLWAEGLIRSGGDLSLAATLINRSRVGRGGLPPATSSNGAPILLNQLAYELEIEQLGLGASPFYFRRRSNGLILGTPFEMPVPAPVLRALGEVPYTFGGSFAPASPTPPLQ